MNKKNQSNVDARLKRALQVLDEVESPSPSIEALTMLVQRTKRKQRNELYVFILLSLLITIFSVAFIVNLPVVYLLLQLLIVTVIAIVGVITFRESVVKHHE